MSDTMKVQPFSVLLRWILKEYETQHAIFGIPASQFYAPQKGSPFVTRDLFGQVLDTPVGPAAGPHTQLTQNILSAWLCGARFIELKTVQIMDELEIPRPCIDMEDEGYNVEWSQELKLDQSVNEYIKAWALIPILNRLLGYEATGTHGTIFNMSVGYNLEGITSAPMLRFMDRLADASAEIGQIREILKQHFPQFADVEIPTCLTNNVTLSTMHGCPPDEIEKIAGYLLTERHLHTTVKLNPTLLGKEQVLDILNHQLGYDYIAIPDAVFEHDLSYERAVALVHSLQQTAAQQHLSFGVKLSNTLPNTNGRGVLPGGEMYMSGRALYPITMNLFHKLDVEFKGDLKVSYSAGADALNVTTLLACGALPVTVASDLLKPGGYARLGQYLENLTADMRRLGAASLAELSKDRSANTARAAAESLINAHYKKEYAPYGLPKVSSALELFDCVTAPCMEPCAVHQDVPAYTWLIAQGRYGQALEVILSRNPLPGVTGYVCTQLCQTRCTRNSYEEPVAIRALKRLAVEKEIGRASCRERV
jgi:putative selenate reductase